VLDYNRSCSVGPNARQSPFLISNHFANSRLGLPSLDIASQINVKSVIEARIAACTDIIGKRPNFLVVDFWSIGDLPEVAQSHNRAVATDFLIGRAT